MPLTRLTLSTGERHLIAGTDPKAISLELEDLGASWLEITILEYDGLARDPDAWHQRTAVVPHGLIVRADTLGPADHREIPDEILADHDEPTSVER